VLGILGACQIGVSCGNWKFMLRAQVSSRYKGDLGDSVGEVISKVGRMVVMACVAQVHC
jgi:hypothetical protein